MLRYCRSACLVIALLLCHFVAGIHDFGVGFHLSLEYGVASVQFANGSVIDVAKLEGGPSYRLKMRNSYVPKILVRSRRIAPRSLIQRALWGRQIPQALLTAQDLRDHLPPWLGGRRPPSQPLVPMLRALKAAVEARLETSISNAQVVGPYRVSEDLREELRSAFSSISLSMPASLHSPAGIFAAGAYGLGKDYGDDCMEQLILSVEYSKAALTAVVAEEECGLFETRRVLHDTTLGSEVPTLNREKLEEALRGVVHLPLDDGGNCDDLTYINNLVLKASMSD